MGKRTWTDEQIERLMNLWGSRSYGFIAKRTGHTETAVRLKAKRLGLGSVKDASDYICAREIARIMGIDVHAITDYWIKKRGLKYRRIKGENRTLWILIRHDDLMNFLKNNQDIWDSRRIEPYALGLEPEWMKEKRTKDRNNHLNKMIELGQLETDAPPGASRAIRVPGYIYRKEE